MPILEPLTTFNGNLVEFTKQLLSATFVNHASLDTSIPKTIDRKAVNKALSKSFVKMVQSERPDLPLMGIRIAL